MTSVVIPRAENVLVKVMMADVLSVMGRFEPFDVILTGSHRNKFFTILSILVSSICFKGPFKSENSFADEQETQYRTLDILQGHSCMIDVVDVHAIVKRFIW